MFKSLSTLSLLAASAMHMVAGQSTSSSEVATGIATAVLNLQGTKVIPDLFPASDLNLSAVLVQTFGSTSNMPGQQLSIEETAQQPTWSLQYSSSALENKTFTIMTLDPGAATATQGNVVRHFLANNVTLNGDQLVNTTVAIAGWFGPAPPPGSGLHRYTTLVFEQPSDFNAMLPDSLSHREEEIDLNFNLADYRSQTGLGSIVAANFFLCENSTAATTSVMPVATSSVAADQISSAASSVSVSAKWKMAVEVYADHALAGLVGFCCPQRIGRVERIGSERCEPVVAPWLRWHPGCMHLCWWRHPPLDSHPNPHLTTHSQQPSPLLPLCPLEPPLYRRLHDISFPAWISTGPPSLECVKVGITWFNAVRVARLEGGRRRERGEECYRSRHLGYC